MYLTFRFGHCWERRYHYHRPPWKKLWRGLCPVFFSGSCCPGSAEGQGHDGTQVSCPHEDLRPPHNPTPILLDSFLCVTDWTAPVFTDISRCFPAEVKKFTPAGRGGQVLLRAAIRQPTEGRPCGAGPHPVRFQRTSLSLKRLNYLLQILADWKICEKFYIAVSATRFSSELYRPPPLCPHERDSLQCIRRRYCRGKRTGESSAAKALSCVERSLV